MLGISEEDGGVKLMPNLNNRFGYVVHSTTLDLYTKLGMDKIILIPINIMIFIFFVGLRVTEILGAVEFTESEFLKEWVD